MIKELSSLKILLIGDFMLDHYYFGSSNRLSPEAPIPVVLFEEEKFIPGGAGNVAINLKSLGVDVYCMGFIGEDTWGKKLISIFSDKKINIEHLEVLANYQTTVKQRIYCENEQLSRLDLEKFQSNWVPNQKIDYNKFDAIILSDYNKGTFHNNWFEYKGKNIILDPKVLNENILHYATIMTPNINELSILTNTDIINEKSLITSSKKLMGKYNLEYLLVTKGDNGMALFSKNGDYNNISPYKVPNPDVTGAGDTVIATFTAIYAKTNNAFLAANVANKAASLVVGKKGTANIEIKDIAVDF